MQLPRAALLATAIIIAIETAFLLLSEPLSGIPVFQPTVDDALAASKRNLLPVAGGKVVLLGDSSTLTDLDPDILKQQTGLDFLNLGMLASLTTAGFSDIGLELMENPDTHPAAIVYGILPQSLEVTDARARSFGFIGRYLIAYNRQSPGYTPSTTDYKEWFVKKHRFNVFPSAHYGITNGYQEFNEILHSRDGYMPELQTYGGPDEVLLSFRADPYSVNPLLNLAKIAKELDIPFVLLINPKPSDAVSTNYLNQVASWISSFEASTGIDVQFADSLSRDSNNFGTATHLSALAAKGYSVEVGQLLAGLL